MTTKRISVKGCDDSTTIAMDLTDAELAFLERLSAAINAASAYSCMPRLYIEEPIAACPHGQELDTYCDQCPDSRAEREP